MHIVYLFALVLLGVVQEPKPFSQWTADENKKAQYDVKGRNIISSALTLDEFYRISICTSAQEMWEILRVTHEGTELE